MAKQGKNEELIEIYKGICRQHKYSLFQPMDFAYIKEAKQFYNFLERDIWSR